LAALHSLLKKESDTKPLVRTFLGKWEAMEKNLLPLLVSQEKDRKIGFATILIVANLT